MKNVELHDILMHNSSINLHIHDNSCTLTVKCYMRRWINYQSSFIIKGIGKYSFIKMNAYILVFMIVDDVCIKQLRSDWGSGYTRSTSNRACLFSQASGC